MRGKVNEIIRTYHADRITPAHAGKSLTLRCRSPIFRDHPRTCGEKRGCMGDTRISAGSPPHMRGKVQSMDFIVFVKGITPAHAGKRSANNFSWSVTADHPRTCGEKAIKLKNLSPVSGSPPHMRGKDSFIKNPIIRKGITPAHAGKRLLLYKIYKNHQDHPRTCGEKYCSLYEYLPKQGSPPHMRGKVTITKQSKTYATDHPRTCGEKLYS